ncbi:MAG: T9SS type A sorting domain-containing protein [Fluviicola sp.]
MRAIIIAVFIVLFSDAEAQNWTTVNSSQYAPLGYIFGGNGWREGNKQFAVNKFDNSVWFAWDNYVHGFDNQGNYFKYDDSNVPVFEDNTNVSTIVELGFASDRTFAVDRFIGLMHFDGVSWTIVSTVDDGNSICTDADSVWVANDQFGYTSWKDGFTTDHSDFTQMERLVSRKGEMWGSSGHDNGFIYKIENSTPNIQLAASNGYLLDDTNFDFKFSPVSDSLFVAGEKGISIAYGGAFIDTITMFNSINMPSSSVREIEIDQFDNVWALFGSDCFTNTSIGYFEFSTNEWTMIYNDSNSPINWSGRVSIELDSQGNLYVADNTDLHVLKINNWPQWLDADEQNFVEFTVYPNPSNGELAIRIDNSIWITDIEVLDINGRVLKRTPFQNKIQLDQESGVYFLRLKNQETIVGTKKIILNQ